MNVKLNNNFDLLSKKYLFDEISARVAAYKKSAPSAHVISLGIGDVTLPLPATVAKEMSQAAKELGTKEGFRGYGDTLGLPELRKAISKRYIERNVHLEADEIFISDGAKSDLCAVPDLFGDIPSLIPSPVYPVYVDSNIIAGKKIRLLEAEASTGFLPLPPKDSTASLIYLCSPNNPTGSVFDDRLLSRWVEYARNTGSVIVFDAAYEAYIRDPALPHSIFEIDGARECSIEICSFSKMAGFTGVRCGWCAIARENPLHSLWRRRQTTKFNGASYISQRGALAALSVEGGRECERNIDYYMNNAKLITGFAESVGLRCYGGEHAPYVWLKCPDNMQSWDAFENILYSVGVITTPGVGFGKNGEGFLRLSAFAPREDIIEAMDRFKNSGFLHHFKF